MNLVLNKFGLHIDDKFRTITALTLIPLMIVMCGFSCNMQSVVQRVDSILVEIGPALQVITALLPLLGAKNIPPSVIQGINDWIPRVQQDVATLQAEIQKDQSTLSTSPDVQSKINGLIANLQNDLTSILLVFRVLDPTTQQKVTAIVTAVAAAVISVENILNAAEGKVSVRVAANNALVKDGKDFKKKLNAVVKAPTGDAAIDAATAKVGL